MDNPTGYSNNRDKGIFSASPQRTKTDPSPHSQPHGSVLYNISIVNNNLMQFPEYTELFETAPQGYNPKSTQSSNFNYKDPFHFSETQSRSEKILSETPKPIETGSVDRHEKIRRPLKNDNFGNPAVFEDKILKGEMLKKICGGIGHKISVQKKSIHETSEFNSNQTVTPVQKQFLLGNLKLANLITENVDDGGQLKKLVALTNDEIQKLRFLNVNLNNFLDTLNNYDKVMSNKKKLAKPSTTEKIRKSPLELESGQSWNQTVLGNPETKNQNLSFHRKGSIMTPLKRNRKAFPAKDSGIGLMENTLFVRTLEMNNTYNEFGIGGDRKTTKVLPNFNKTFQYSDRKNCFNPPDQANNSFSHIFGDTDFEKVKYKDRQHQLTQFPTMTTPVRSRINKRTPRKDIVDQDKSDFSNGANRNFNTKGSNQTQNICLERPHGSRSPIDELQIQKIYSELNYQEKFNQLEKAKDQKLLDTSIRINDKPLQVTKAILEKDNKHDKCKLSDTDSETSSLKILNSGENTPSRCSDKNIADTDGPNQNQKLGNLNLYDEIGGKRINPTTIKQYFQDKIKFCNFSWVDPKKPQEYRGKSKEAHIRTDFKREPKNKNSDQLFLESYKNQQSEAARDLELQKFYMQEYKNLMRIYNSKKKVHNNTSLQQVANQRPISIIISGKIDPKSKATIMPFSEFAEMFKETISKEIKYQSPVVDRKIFLEQVFASFIEWNFSSEFAEPRRISKISQMTPDFFSNLAKILATFVKTLYKLQFHKNRLQPIAKKLHQVPQQSTQTPPQTRPFPKSQKSHTKNSPIKSPTAIYSIMHSKVGY